MSEKEKTPNTHTCSMSVLDDDERFELVCLFHSNTHKGMKEPYLTLSPTSNHRQDVIWDNHEWLLELFKDLKSKSKSEKTEDFKAFCKKWNWDYKEMRKKLVSAYKSSKKLKMW